MNDARVDVLEVLAEAHERHRRSVVSAAGWIVAALPVGAAAGLHAGVTARMLAPLVALGVVALGAIGLARAGRVEAGYAVLVLCGSAVAFDAQAVQQVSGLALAYLPVLVMIAASVLTRRWLLATAAYLLLVTLATQIALYTAFTVPWFSQTLDTLTILVLATAVLHVDRSKVSRDRDLLRGALIEIQAARLREEAFARELECSARAAHAANDARAQLLLRVSHELRTPLNAILGYAELVDEDEELPDALRPDIANITRSGRSLLRMIEDLLDLSRAGVGHLAVAPATIALPELLAPVVDALGPAVSAAGNRLVVDVAAEPVRVDTDRTRQILCHLLSNAARYTRDGQVELRATVAGAEVRFEVRDTGIGIAAERLPHLFLPFAHAEHRTEVDGQPRGGVGLGLALVDGLVRGMGGQVEVESELGRGSTFRVLLPQADRSAPSATSSR